jgi:hypothetical protein
VLIARLRDKTFFLAHIVISALLGVFCGGLYFKTNLTIAGFQSRVGTLFFLVRPRISSELQVD